MPAGEWGPIVFATDSTSPVLSRALQRDTLRRLARGIYTGDTVSGAGGRRPPAPAADRGPRVPRRGRCRPLGTRRWCHR